MKIAVTTRIQSVREVVDLVSESEKLGFWGVGISDTAPRLYQAAYPTVTAALMATNKIRISTHVTNLVSQHWSVHATTARSFEELAPGRFILGLATGDGAVRSVGLEPSRWSDFEVGVRNLREISPPDLTIQVAATGPIGAAVVGRVADDMLLGVGQNAEALLDLVDVADEAARRVGRGRVGRWLTLPICVVATEAEVQQARAHIRGVAVAMAHFGARSGRLAEGLDPELSAILTERLEQYDYRHHGVGKSRNGVLFEDIPELEKYIVDRMVVVGTVSQCRGQLVRIARAAELDGFYLGPHAPASNPDELEHLSRVAEVVSSFTNE